MVSPTRFSLRNCRDYNVASFSQNKSRVSFAVVCPAISRAFLKEDVYFSPAHLPPCGSPSPALSGDGKQLWRPPGCAGVDGEVAASPQLSKKSEERRGREAASAEERARTVFRLQQTAASLSFSGHRPSPSPLTSSSSRPLPFCPSSLCSDSQPRTPPHCHPSRRLDRSD